MWYYEAKVIFRGYFPLDMLRYDQCFPKDGIRLLKDYQSEHVEVTVGKYSPHKRADMAWTQARWNSFGAALFFTDTMIKV